MDLDKAWNNYITHRHAASDLYFQADAFYKEMCLPFVYLPHKSENHLTAKELAFELYNAADQIVQKATKEWNKALQSVYGYVTTVWVYRGSEKRGGYDCKIVDNGVIFRYS